MPRHLVQFWTNHEETTDNLERLEADVLVLRKRVWERAEHEIKHHNRLAHYRTIGWIFLSLAASTAYLWMLAR